MNIRSKSWKLAFAGMLAASAAPVAAETLLLEAVYPAAVDLPSDVEVLAAEPFGGDAGPDAQIAIMDTLSSAQIDGEPWFGFSQAGSVFGDDDALSPDAALRGSVRTETDNRRTEPRIDRECVARNDKGKCIEREDVRVPCRLVSVRVSPRVQLVGPDGRQFYSYRDPLTAERRYCQDEETPSSSAMIDALIEDMALQVRSDLAPKMTRTNVRIMERRKGLSGDDRNAFRDAVKLTNNDPYGACAAFAALEANNPQQSSLLFNIGLCHEVEGDLSAATDYYRRVLELDPGRDYAVQGLGRIQWQRRALAQLESREQT